MSTRLGKRKTFWGEVSASMVGEGYPQTLLGNFAAPSPIIQNMPNLAFGLVQSFLYGNPLRTSPEALQMMDLCNGFERFTPNNFSYIANAPGNPSFPFRKNEFVFTLSSAADHPNRQIISKFSAMNGELGVATNGVSGRTIYLRRCSVVTFTFLPPVATPAITMNHTNQFNPMNTFISFTTDPIGGHAGDTIHDIPPPILDFTPTLTPTGENKVFMVGQGLPNIFFYQCNISPGMGGMVVIIDGDDCQPCAPQCAPGQMGAQIFA